MLSPNTLINKRYLVKRVMSDRCAVYEAFDLTTRKLVALKQVADDGLAQRLWQLRHPSLPAIRECIVNSERTFLVMEYIPGSDMGTSIADNGALFSFDRVRRWADQLLDALDYIHTLQPPLIHGDITPHHIKLSSDDRAVLLGFASSQSAASPEQLAGAPPDERSDLFALAATIYLLLTGKPPNPIEKRIRVRENGAPDLLPAPHSLNTAIPVAFSDVLMQALALDPHERPTSAAVIRAALAASVAPVTVQTSDEALVELPSKRPRRGVVIVGAAVVALFLLFVLARFGSSFGPARTVAQSTEPVPTSNPVSEATLLPTPLVVPLATTPLASTVTPTSVPPTPSPPPNIVTPLPTVSPAPQIVKIDVQTNFTGTLPLILSVRGTALNQVQRVRLVATGRQPIDTMIQITATDLLTVSMALLPEPLNGALAYQLEFNGVTQQNTAIVLRDFIQHKGMQGVLTQYAYTKRVAQDALGNYTRMRIKPDISSSPIGQLRNGDEIEILRDDLADWYQIRIRTSGDSAQIGQIGWIERWLVDNVHIPVRTR